MNKICPKDVVKGDVVRFFVNKRAKLENKYHMGEVLSVSGRVVKVRGVKFDQPLTLTKYLVQVVKPVLTQERLKTIFNVKGNSSGRKNKKKVTTEVAGMSFSYSKRA